MLVALIAAFLVIVIVKAGRRGRAHLLAGERSREFGWYLLVQVACLGLIALPFYEGRVTADVASAVVEYTSQPQVPGGGTDQVMAALKDAGFDRTVEFVNQFADADRADTIDWFRAEVEDNWIGELPWHSRWYVRMVDGGRLADNLEGIAAAQEYRILPLFSAAAYARDVCGTEEAHRQARELFEKRMLTFEFADAALVAGAVEEMTGRCTEFDALVDRDAVRADTTAYGKPSMVEMFWSGLSLSYEPGRRHRAEG